MKFPVFMISLIIFGGMSCNNSGESSGKKRSAVQTHPDEKPHIVHSSVNIMNRGREIYNQTCLTCHQENGSGVPGMYPPLVKSDFITGDNEKLIKLILEGMSGPVEIKGEQYNNIMPPQSDLDDKAISDLLTYLRSSYGNSADPVSAEEVARVRKTSR